MKTLTKLLIPVLAGSLGIFGNEGYGQAKTDMNPEGEKIYEQLMKGLETSTTERVSRAYLDSSLKVLEGKYTGAGYDFFYNLEISRDHLEKAIIGYKLFIEKSKKENKYKNKSLDFSMEVVSRIDTLDARKTLLFLKDIKNLQTEISDKCKANIKKCPEKEVLNKLQESYIHTLTFLNKCYAKNKEY